MYKVIGVRFQGNERIYRYLTQLNLEKGKMYNIYCDGRGYSSPVTVVEVGAVSDSDAYRMQGWSCKTITSADKVFSETTLIPKKYYFNEKKGVTVVLWEDGTKTLVKCSDADTFSKEVGIAMAVTKKALGNADFRRIMKNVQEEG